MTYSLSGQKLQNVLQWWDARNEFVSLLFEGSISNAFVVQLLLAAACCCFAIIRETAVEFDGYVLSAWICCANLAVSMIRKFNKACK